MFVGGLLPYPGRCFDLVDVVAIVKVILIRTMVGTWQLQLLLCCLLVSWVLWYVPCQVFKPVNSAKERAHVRGIKLIFSFDMILWLKVINEGTFYGS